MNPTHVFKREEEHDGGKKKIICQGFLLPSPLPPPNLTSSHSPSASFPCTPHHHSFNPFRRFPEGTGANKGTQLARSREEEKHPFSAHQISAKWLSDLTVLNAPWQRPWSCGTESHLLHDVSMPQRCRWNSEEP
ncbi:hypothetical protein fugu_006906 [Takifugu bimaculatus]|uniref:Uncharacterized protein n=1 Tax=Takifugu bimaculatus TaxID=433685 RepID=A0A4Z2B4Z3_9TELE|nr:hypothetical protein fugu_006906 [Takifugu bimaculatus]